MWVADDDLIELQRAAARSWQQCAQEIADAAQRLVRLNLTTARAALDDSKSALQTALDAERPQQLVLANSRLLQPAVPRLLSYGRHMVGIASDAGAAVGAFADKQIRDARRRFDEMLAQARRHAPQQEPTLAILKDMLGWADRAYDEWIDTCRRLAHAVEAGAAAADAPAAA